MVLCLLQGSVRFGTMGVCITPFVIVTGQWSQVPANVTFLSALDHQNRSVLYTHTVLTPATHLDGKMIWYVYPLY